MVAIVVWTLVVLAAAALVLVVASVADSPADDDTRGIRAYLDDVRAGARTLRDGRRSGARRGRVSTADDRQDDDQDDAALDEFFAATQVQAPAYVAVEDLTDTLARARERAARGVQGLARR